MADAVGLTTGGVLVFLAVLHVYWACGGRVGSGVTVPERDARPLFTPTRGATLVVAGLLLADALLLWGRVARWESVAPAWVFETAAGGSSALFFARAVGDFRWVGFFKRRRGTAFARLDTWLYSPLSAALALGCLIVACR